MGKTKDLGHLAHIVAYDSANHITVPAGITMHTNQLVASQSWVTTALGSYALSSSLGSYVPTSRTITINGTSYDLSANREWNITSMIYPAAGIPLSTGTAWGTSITNNSANWNTAYGWGNHASAGYLTASTVLGTLLTPYAVGANTAVTTTDTIETAIEKLQGQINARQASLSGTGFVKISGTTISYDNSTYLTGITSGQVTTALGFTPVTNARTITINGTTYDLSADRSWTVSGSDSTKMPLAGGTFTGLVTFAFSNTDAVQWPLVRFGPSSTGWDEGIIKASSTEGVFGRYGMGIHFDSARAFGIYSSSWTKVMGFRSDGVTSYKALDVPTLAIGNSSSYLFSTNVWAGTAGYPGYQFTGGNTRFGFSSTSGAVDVYTDGNFYCGIDYNGSNNLVWHQGNLTNLNQLSNGPGYVTSSGTVLGINYQGFGTGSINVSYGYSAVLRNENGNGGNLTYAPILHLAASDTMWQIQGDFYNSSTLRWRAGYAGSWYAWRDILHTGNYGSYVVPISGGTMSGNLKITPVSESWGEGLSFVMPNASTWGGLRWRRERGGYDGNWAIGYTALDSSDDLVFIANNGGAQVNDILRLTKAGNISTIGSFTANKKITVSNSTLDSHFLAAGGAPSYRLADSVSGPSYQGLLGMATYYGHFVSMCNPGDTVVLGITSGGRVFITSGANGAYMSYNATSFTSNSDIRLKNITGGIDNAIDKIKSLRAIKYTWKSDDTNKVNIGLVAQEVQAVLPELVDVGNDSMGTLGVRYSEMIPVVVKGIQEQQNKIEELTNMVSLLQETIQTLLNK